MMYDMYHHCGVEEWYDHRSVSAWETSQGLQYTHWIHAVYTLPAII